MNAKKKVAKKRPARNKITHKEIEDYASGLGLELTEDLIKKISARSSKAASKAFMRKLRSEPNRGEIAAEIKRLGLASERDEVQRLVDTATRITGMTPKEFIQRSAVARLEAGNTAVNVAEAKKIKLPDPIDPSDMLYSAPTSPAYVTTTEDGEQLLEITVKIPIGDWQRDGYGVSLQRPPAAIRLDTRLNIRQRVALGKLALGQYRSKGKLGQRAIRTKEQALLRVLEIIGDEIARVDEETRNYIKSLEEVKK